MKWFPNLSSEKLWPSTPTQPTKGDWKADTKPHIWSELVALLNHYKCCYVPGFLVCHHESSFTVPKQLQNNRRRHILILLHSSWHSLVLSHNTVHLVMEKLARNILFARNWTSVGQSCSLATLKQEILSKTELRLNGNLPVLKYFSGHENTGWA